MVRNSRRNSETITADRKSKKQGKRIKDATSLRSNCAGSLLVLDFKASQQRIKVPATGRKHCSSSFLPRSTAEEFTQTSLPISFENHDTLTPHRSKKIGKTERVVRRGEEKTASALVQPDLTHGGATQWNAAATCVTYMIPWQTDKQLIRNIRYSLQWSCHTI